MQQNTITLHLVSEATGQTLDAVARACIAQFPNTDVRLRHWNLIRSRCNSAAFCAILRWTAGLSCHP